MAKLNVTYSIEFNPTTGSERPWEVWVVSDTTARKVCASCKTLAGAEKSRKGFILGREQYFNISAPQYSPK